jgi:hypothetical protein
MRERWGCSVSHLAADRSRLAGAVAPSRVMATPHSTHPASDAWRTGTESAPPSHAYARLTGRPLAAPRGGGHHAHAQAQEEDVSTNARLAAAVWTG